jgi:thioredoxin 1
MKVEELNQANFLEVVPQPGVVLVDCWAEWCGACRQFAPVFERVAEDYPQHTFATVDASEEAELIKQLGIEHIPALLLYRDGLLLFKQPGYYEEYVLRDIISQAESLNMDLVRADMDRSEMP